MSAGRASIKIATYLLEKGIDLGTLEQLAGSRTLGSTVTTQYHLRSYNLLSLGLVALWLISPVGGQAALRVFYLDFDAIVVPTVVQYFDTDAQSRFEYQDA